MFPNPSPENNPSTNFNRGNSLAQTGFAAENEASIDARRTPEDISGELTIINEKIDELNEKIDRAIDSAVNNKDGMGTTHTEIGRQLTKERDALLTLQEELQNELEGFKNATAVTLH